MDELLNRIAAGTGLSAGQAQQAIGHILVYMKNEGTDPAVETMIGGTPGAAAAMQAAGEEDGDGLSGAFGGGIMALGSKLMGLGLDMGQIRTIATDLVAFARTHVGADTVDRVIGTTPGIAQFA